MKWSTNSLAAVLAAAAILAVVPAAHAAVVSDSFTGTNGTLLENHVGETGAIWTFHSNYPADLKLQDGRVWGPEWGLYFASGVPPTAEYDVSADLHVKSNAGAIGLVARASTSGTEALYLARYNAASGSWELVKCSAGACANIGTSYAQTLTVGSTYALKLEVRNATKKLFVDGIQRVSSTDNTITQVGRAGIRSGPGVTTATTGYHLDNFTVDAAATETTITSGPSGPTNNTSPSFTFTSTPSGGTFECKLDGPGSTVGTWASCPSTKSYSALAQGSYTFSARATVAGVTDSTPATRSFTVDTTAPETTIASGPSGPTNATSVSFSFTSETGASFECKLDGPGTVTGTYGVCPSPKAYSGLAAGGYTFSVRAKDAAGNTDPTPATRSFTVDTTAPETTIDSGPTGTITTNSASFGFSSETGATFECKLDGPGTTTGTYSTCSTGKTYSNLANGSYTFSVRATDAAGNTDATPATRTFTVSVSSGVTCDKTASPGGTISTKAGLLAALSAGQTGCFRAGTYGSPSDPVLNITTANITLRSYPGETATIKGRIVFKPTGSGGALRELRLDGFSSPVAPSPTIDGATNVTIADNDISNQDPNGTPTSTAGSICVHPTSFTGPQANGFVIERNRIHNCGQLPFTNHHHGIYADDTTSGTIRNNVIYDNADRGISLHYDTSGTQIYNNTIDGNGRGLHFGDGSNSNLAEKNVITNAQASSTGYNLTRYNITVAPLSNIVRDVCLKEGNPNGFDTAGGIEPGFTNDVTLGFWVNSDGSDPYVNRGAKDFRLATGSVCAGRGWGAPDDVAAP